MFFRPVLDQTTYFAKIYANSSERSFTSQLFDDEGNVLKVKAHDIDTGLGGSLKYQIIALSSENQVFIDERFVIDKRSGAIQKLNGNFLYDHSYNNIYQFMVRILLMNALTKIFKLTCLFY